MKLQNLTIIFIIIILPVVLVLSAYVGYGIKTINKQNMYNTGLISATHDAVFAFELNTKNDVYYNNAENKRSNIKAAIKTFENSLSNTCNLGLYNNEAIEEYIPAIVFGLYDGFYMYSPTQTQDQGYKHELRNYVYYTEEIKEGNIDIIIRYTLDNYVAVSGTIDGKYVTRAGYLVNLADLSGSKIEEELSDTKIKYKGIEIGAKEIEEQTLNSDQPNKISNEIEKDNRFKISKESSSHAKKYFRDAYKFTDWFMNETKIGATKGYEYLKIGDGNDPEDENSAFVRHKRSIMKEKIEETLNSSITAYANKTRNNYKMPKFTEEDWDKIYNNISVITFVQGMNLGFKGYNNYCILNSTNNQEYVNPNLIYFSDGDNYHDIRCSKITNNETTGYRIGSFEKVKYEIANSQGEVTDTDYYYKHNELACYECVNGSVSTTQSIYNYVNTTTNDNIKKSYFEALARERNKTIKLLDATFNAEYKEKYTITYDVGNIGRENDITVKKDHNEQIIEGNNIIIGDVSQQSIVINNLEKYKFKGWMINGDENSNIAAGEIYQPIEDTTLTAIWEVIRYYKVEFDTKGGTHIGPQTIRSGEKATKPISPSKERCLFINWKTKDNTVFDFNTPITSDIILYANYIDDFEMKIIVCNANNESEKLSQYSDIDKTIYTNKEKVKVKGDVATIKDYNISGKFKEGETEEGSYEVIVKPIIEGVTLEEKAVKQKIVIDRKAPNIYNFERHYENVMTKYIDVSVTDDESGIKSVIVKSTVLNAFENREMEYDKDSNKYVHKYDTTIFLYCDKEITATDKAGNVAIKNYK